MRKKRLITCIMVMAVVCMISVNAFAVTVTMGSKYNDDVDFSIDSVLTYSENNAETISLTSMSMLVVNNSGGPVNYARYTVALNSGYGYVVDVELWASAYEFDAIPAGGMGYIVVPTSRYEPFGTYAKTCLFEIGASKGSDLYWTYTTARFPYGSASYTYY